MAIFTEGSSSEDVWYERTPREAEQLRGLEECDPQRFVEIFNSDHLRHVKVASVASVRLAENAAELERLRKALEEKSRDCEAIARQAAEDLRQVDELRRKVRDGETAIKIQDEELRIVKEKLAQSLSELGAVKTDLDIEKTLVREMTQQVLEHDAERAGLITEVIPYACRALVDSDEVGQWLGPVISANRDEERALVLEEFQALGLVDLATRADYVSDASAGIAKAIQDYKCAEFPFVEKLSAKPQASFRDLLLIQPLKLQEPVQPSVPPTASADVGPSATPLSPATAPVSHSEPASLNPQKELSAGNASTV